MSMDDYYMMIVVMLELHDHQESCMFHREGVMEFLLVNHPLDCPICDQAGECDLQVWKNYSKRA